MKKKGHLFTLFLQSLRSYKIIYFFFFILFGIYFANTVHTNFPDEFDNIVGGWYITRGILPYAGFFSHHNPGAYYLATLITLFTRQSFVQFRFVWSAVLFIAALLSYIFLRRKYGANSTYFFLLYLVLLGFGATYFWAQMLLAETVVGYAFIPAYALVLFKYLKNETLTTREIIVISILLGIALLTSFTFIFAIALFVCGILYYLVKQKGVTLKRIFLTVGILCLPYVLFLFYLVGTKSLPEFYFQSIYYNREYYIYNFPVVSGTVSKNPARYALSIFYNTTNQFLALFQQVRDFNFSYPVNITLLAGNVGLLIYLLSRKKYFLAAMIYCILVYVNARGEPLTSKETDFHSTVYFMLSIFNLSFVLFALIHELNTVRSRLLVYLYTLIFFFISSYGLFLTITFGRSFADKTYGKIMGQAPAIYDEPVVAPIINKIVSKNDYFWIGPFEFQELLYINGKLPSKYHWFLPANARSDKIKTEIISDLTKHKPKLIVFKEDLGFFGTNPQDFNYPIVNFLREHYFRLEDLEKEGRKYRPRIVGLHNFDVAVNFYYDKERKEEIISELIDKGIIESISQ